METAMIYIMAVLVATLTIVLVIRNRRRIASKTVRAHVMVTERRRSYFDELYERRQVLKANLVHLRLRQQELDEDINTFYALSEDDSQRVGFELGRLLKERANVRLFILSAMAERHRLEKQIQQRRSQEKNQNLFN